MSSPPSPPPSPPSPPPPPPSPPLPPSQPPQPTRYIPPKKNPASFPYTRGTPSPSSSRYILPKLNRAPFPYTRGTPSPSSSSTPSSSSSGSTLFPEPNRLSYRAPPRYLPPNRNPFAPIISAVYSHPPGFNAIYRGALFNNEDYRGMLTIHYTQGHNGPLIKLSDEQIRIADKISSLVHDKELLGKILRFWKPLNPSHKGDAYAFAGERAAKHAPSMFRNVRDYLDFTIHLYETYQIGGLLKFICHEAGNEGGKYKLYSDKEWRGVQLSDFMAIAESYPPLRDSTLQGSHLSIQLVKEGERHVINEVFLTGSMTDPNCPPVRPRITVHGEWTKSQIPMITVVYFFC